jgi:hypothetical protein
VLGVKTCATTPGSKHSLNTDDHLC